MTQGLITLIDGKTGLVYMKIIAGSEGQSIICVVEKIKALDHRPSIEEAYEIAQKVGFGAPENLVVITEDKSKYEGDDDLSPLYQETFLRPDFNPRWKNGTSDYFHEMKI